MIHCGVCRFFKERSGPGLHYADFGMCCRKSPVPGSQPIGTESIDAESPAIWPLVAIDDCCGEGEHIDGQA